MTKTKKTKTFEQALEGLEKIVSQIEEGKVPLEESIEKYAEATKLIKLCQSILAAAEKKIKLLAKGEGETLSPAGELEEEEQS